MNNETHDGQPLRTIHPEDLSRAGTTYGALMALAEVVCHVRNEQGTDAPLLRALADIENQIVALAGERFFGDHKPDAVGAFIARGADFADAYDQAALKTGAAVVANATATMLSRRGFTVSMTGTLDGIFDAAGDAREVVEGMAR